MLLELQLVSPTDETVRVDRVESLWGNAVLLLPAAAMPVLFSSVLAVDVVAPLSSSGGHWSNKSYELAQVG